MKLKKNEEMKIINFCYSLSNYIEIRFSYAKTNSFYINIDGLINDTLIIRVSDHKIPINSYHHQNANISHIYSIIPNYDLRDREYLINEIFETIEYAINDYEEKENKIKKIRENEQKRYENYLRNKEEKCIEINKRKNLINNNLDKYSNYIILEKTSKFDYGKLNHLKIGIDYLKSRDGMIAVNPKTYNENYNLFYAFSKTDKIFNYENMEGTKKIFKLL